MPTQFGRTASVLATLGALTAVAVPFALRPATPEGVALGRSVVASGVLALVFAGYNAVWVAYLEEPRFAPGVVAAALGAWITAAPPVYGAEGAIVGGVQVAGALTGAFAVYTVLEAFEGL